jgi:hypothetical protein
MKACTLGLLGGWLVITSPACTFKLDLNLAEVPGAGHDAGHEQPSPRLDAASANDGGTDADTAEVLHDAAMDASVSADSSTETDAQAADAEVEAGGPEPEPIRHAACSTDRPWPLPAAPRLKVNASGRPSFDFWRDMSCDEVADYPLCSAEYLEGNSSWQCGSCWIGEEGGEGVCNFSGVSASSCDSVGELLTLREGLCGTCIPVAAHTRACCADLPGFDCRAWPYPADSKPGQACAEHSDCEPGLICRDSGYQAGVCVCPGASYQSYPFSLTCMVGS